MDYKCSPAHPKVSGNMKSKIFPFCDLEIEQLASLVESTDMNILNILKNQKNDIQWHLTRILQPEQRLI